jgi:hypothetical protein
MNDPEMYRAQLDTVFRVRCEADDLGIRLVAVDSGRQDKGIQQFSLFFHGPADRVLPQGTYEIQHDALGSLALFIVPIVGSNHERIVYQACFTRPMPPE